MNFERSLAIRAAEERNNNVSVDEAISILEAEIWDSFDPNNPNKDKGIMALVALKKTKEDIKRRKVKRVAFWIVAVTFLLTSFFVGKAFLAENVVVGEHVTTMECTIPWGKDQLTVVRHLVYPSKALFGYQVLDKSHPSIHDEIKLPGDTITILGADDRRTEKNPNGKWWRENFAKGEFGSRKLKYADQIWFIGDKDKTALTSRDKFCK